MRKAQAKAERMLNENEARAALRRTLNEAEEAVSRRDARQEPIPKPSRPIRAGDLVEIPGVKTPAEVVSVGKDGTLQLKAGILKMKAKVDEVRLIEDDERAARKKTPPFARTPTAPCGLLPPGNWTSEGWRHWRRRAWWKTSFPPPSWANWRP